MNQRIVLGGTVVSLAALAAIFHPVGLGQRSTPSLAMVASPAPRSLAVAKPSTVVVHVAGSVHRAGVYQLPATARVDRAVAAAGGPTADADPIGVNLAAPLADGEQIIVPAKGAGAVNNGGVEVRRPRRDTGRSGRSARFGGSVANSRGMHKPPPSEPIDLNAADERQLQRLPGIGPSLAARILAFRRLNGAFRHADELLDVAGMTERRLEAISPYIRLR